MKTETYEKKDKRHINHPWKKDFGGLSILHIS